MKKRLLSRRGAAIELAIAVIFLMMALSIILVSTSTLQVSHRKKDMAEFENKVELMQITDCIIEGSSLPEGFTYETSERTENETVYTIYDVYEGENVVLTIEIDDDGNITSWN